MNLSAFLAENAERLETEKCVISDRFKDENGEPVKWEIQPISGDEDEAIRKKCQIQVKMPNKKNVYTTELDRNAYIRKLIVACVVYPNLNDAALQQSYGVNGAENLIKTMLTAGEYAELGSQVSDICGFDRETQEEIDEIKN